MIVDTYDKLDRSKIAEFIDGHKSVKRYGKAMVIGQKSYLEIQWLSDMGFNQIEYLKDFDAIEIYSGARPIYVHIGSEWQELTMKSRPAMFDKILSMVAPGGSISFITKHIVTEDYYRGINEDDPIDYELRDIPENSRRTRTASTSSTPLTRAEDNEQIVWIMTLLPNLRTKYQNH